MRKWLALAVAAAVAGIIYAGYNGAASACVEPTGAEAGEKVKAKLDEFLERSLAARAESGMTEIVYLNDEHMITQVYSPDATLRNQAVALNITDNAVVALKNKDQMILPVFAKMVLASPSDTTARTSSGFYSITLVDGDGQSALVTFVIQDCKVELLTSEAEGVSVAMNYGLTAEDLAILTRGQN